MFPHTSQRLELGYEEILFATNNFSNENLITEGLLGKVYKGQLRRNEDLINITVRRLDTKYGQGNELHTEISTLKIMEHNNFISVLGHYDDNDEKIIIYEQASNGTLDQHISDPSLTWFQRLQICLGVARALDCIHFDVIHCDINSSNIFLDEDWEPKIYGFELSTKYPQSWRHRLLYSRYFGTNTNTMTPKYDVYCFGVLLLEILCYKKPVITNDGFQEELDGIIDPSLKKQMDTQSLTLFTEIANKCLNKQVLKRPNMDRIVKELEEVLELQWKYENPEHSIATDKGASFHNLKRYGIGHKEILSATNYFSDENLITKDALGKVYKGQLLRNENSIKFSVRRLDSTYGQGDELQMEISMLENFKDNNNIISILGYYDKNNDKIIVYKHACYGTLDQHLSNPTLTLSQRLQICLGVARGLNHVHYDVIHCDISSSKIFLDEDWEPKIYGFELSTKYPQSWRHRLLFSRYFHNGNIMTPKYDVYSFGVVLFEVFYGRKPTITNGVFQEEPDIDNNLMKQMEKRSLKIFKELVEKCLNQQLVERPSMNKIVKDLEEVMESQLKRANLENLNDAEEGTSYNILEIPLSEIEEATNNFHISCRIGTGGYAEVFKAELNFLRIQSLSSMEKTTKEDPAKINKIVAIKKITNPEDENAKQGFFTELDLLSRYKHPNIVSLLGFSREASQLILVYEFAFKGSLGDYLETDTFNLTWEKRLQICLGIALGINHLHNNKDEKLMVIHRDIKSDNILLDANLNAKLGDFGLSKSHDKNLQASVIQTKIVAGTQLYTDPEYVRTGRYKRESDIYSFGVVLFEVLSGRQSYRYTGENDLGLAPIARRSYIEGTLKELIDPKMIEEDGDHIFTLNRGPNQDSFQTFLEIGNKCIAESQSSRPKIEEVIKQLQTAIELQGKTLVLSRFLLEKIEFATESFAETNCIGRDTIGMVYKVNLDQIGNDRSLASGKNDSELSKNHPPTVAVKRINIREGEKGKQEFFEELEMRISYKHPNIVSILGFCDEGNEMIFVYEPVSEISLDDYLKRVDKNDTFTWIKRVEMCLGIARGLNHLHTKRADPQMILRIDVKSANILLDSNWGAKFGYFVISKLQPANQGLPMKVCEDPKCENKSNLEKKSDIYSFGVVLFEIFGGRVAYDPVYINENDQNGLASIARQCFKDGTTMQRILDPRLKEELGDDVSVSYKISLHTFINIAYQCLGEVAKRPTIETVILELDKSLSFLLSPPIKVYRLPKH